MPTAFYNSAIGGHAAAASLEDTAARKGRDLDNRGGEWNVKSGTLAKGLDPADNLTLAATGREDREFNQRKGDLQYAGTLEAPGAPKYDADGRNARLYADRTTLVSHLSGEAFNPTATDSGA